MHIIVGLGNPGEKYDGTRHNVGFEALDALLKKYEPLSKSTWDESKKTKSLIKKVEICNTTTLLAKPQTYMNNSGMAVSLLLNYYKVTTDGLIIIHDELDLPLGKIQVRYGGGTAGHNGIESIIDSIKTDKFIRIRMGVGHPKGRNLKSEIKSDDAVSQYVVSHFLETEQKEVRLMKKHVQKQLELLLQHGFETFISKFNAKA